MGSLAPLRVLVADDDPVSRFVVRAAVERLGHVAIVAHDGVEAMAIFERERPAGSSPTGACPGSTAPRSPGASASGAATATPT